MSIVLRLRSAAALILLVTTIFAGLVFDEHVNTVATRGVVHNCRAAIDLAQEVLSALKDAETGQRGFLLTGSMRYLQPFQSAEPRLKTLLSKLATATASSPSISPLVDQLRQLSTDKLAELDETIKLRQSKGIEGALQVVLTNRGELLMEEAREKTEDILRAERDVLEPGTARLAQLDEKMRWILLIGGPIVFCIVLLTFERSGWVIRRSVKQLDAGIRQVAAGNFTSEVAAKGGGGELNRLARSFNVMAERLRDELQQRMLSEEVLAVANSELQAQAKVLEARNHVIDLLGKLAHRLPGCAAEDEFVKVVECFAPQILSGSSGVLYIRSSSQTVLRQIGTWGQCSGSEPEFAPGECWAMRRGQPHVIEDMRSDVLCGHITTKDLHGYACLPLVAQGDTVGLLFLMDYAAADSCNPLLLAETVALALANLQLRETLRNQSIRDPLTSLFNRRYLEETLELYIARARRSAGMLSVIFLDVDNFKNFNDTFGHEAGDLVLRQVGGLFDRYLRRGDIASRFGGEEFLLVMPSADAAQAVLRAEEIRAAVSDLSITHRGQTLSQVTISCGVAVFPKNGEEAQDLIAAADRQLYKAKRNGRNRVEHADGIAALEQTLEAI